MNDPKERLFSLDALRGADMLFIMGFAGAVISACKWLGFGGDCWLAEQMTHVKWHGFRHHDTIFPLFLFLAGVSWPFSLASQISKGYKTSQICLRIIKRAFVLILLGLFSRTFFRFEFDNVRYDSVLAHIGICWAGAAFLYLCVKNWYGRMGIAIGLLILHWLVLFLFTAPDMNALLSSTDPKIMKIVAGYKLTGQDGFSFVGNIAGWIDRTIMPGVLYETVFDPDGILGKITGIALAMFGMAAGGLIREKNLSGNRKTVLLLCAGLVLLLICLIWKEWCPVNKKIWTSTFVLASVAYSCIALAVFYWIIDVKGIKKWTFFFRVIGMNAITIYMLMRIVNFSGISEYFFGGIAELGNKDWHMLTVQSGKILIEWLLLWFLYKKKAFFRA